MVANKISEKDELLNWIQDLNNDDLIHELLQLKKNINFDERFSKGISVDEARKRTHEFLKSLTWNPR